MHKSPTLQTIADLAGVSKNTVSCALRAHSRISKTTRERILAIAQEVGYRPNPMVSALMQSLRRSHPVSGKNNLAFIHAGETSEGWQQQHDTHQMFLGAKQRAQKLGYSLGPVWVSEPGLTARRLTSVLLHRGVVGLLIAPVPEGTPDLPIDWNHFASAAMGFSLKFPALHRTATFFTHTIPRAARELTARGYKHIGIVFSRVSDQRVDHAWEAGAAIALSQRARGVQLRVFRHNPATPERFINWWQREQPEALIAESTKALLQHLTNNGIPLPATDALATLIDEDETTPGASIVRDWQAIGAAATDLVAAQLMSNERGLPAKANTVMIEGQWNPGRPC